MKRSPFQRTCESFTRRMAFALILLHLKPASCKAQAYVLPNEKSVFAFKTKNGEKAVLAKDTSDKYLIYRFGTANSIEMEFPEKENRNKSWDSFQYSYWLRGGGRENEGLDLNYIQFTRANFKYVLYDTYYAIDESENAGIKVIDLKTGVVKDIKGLPKTKKGSLLDFRFMDAIKKSEEIFD